MVPNRIIKDTIWTSPNFNKLSAQAERHFYRVLLAADDYGCFECTPKVVKGKCYPLKNIAPAQIAKYQEELGKLGILGFWKDGDRQFAKFLMFDKHNTKYGVTKEGKPTRHRRKTPDPPKKLLPTFASPEQTVSNPKSLILNPESSITNPKKIFVEDSDEFRLASLLFQKIQERKPDYKEPNLQSWAKDIDLMLRIDKRKPEIIDKAILWCQVDDFWQNNILSAGKLRKQFDRLEMEMRKPKKGRETPPAEVKVAEVPVAEMESDISQEENKKRLRKLIEGIGKKDMSKEGE